MTVSISTLLKRVENEARFAQKEWDEGHVNSVCITVDELKELIEELEDILR